MRWADQEKNDWQGVAKDTAPHAIPPGFFQEDAGGDRFYRGVWRRRRGLIRTNLDRITAATPTSVMGFEITTPSFSSGTFYAFVIGAGAHIYGCGALGEQTF